MVVVLVLVGVVAGVVAGVPVAFLLLVVMHKRARGPAD
jgi:hypothetical protein